MNSDSTFAPSVHSTHFNGGFSNTSNAQAPQLEKLTADVRQTDDQHGQFQRRGNHETTGPLREIMHHQDSLYRYLNWEDPLRTLGSYFLALGVLSAAHYFPWTRTALKYSSIALGVVSFTEFANRVFTDNTLLARLRPREYATLDEATLNATLKDVHDLLQHLTVQAQKTILGEDLSSTFISFIIFTSLYMFSYLLSPFGIAILALTTAYIVPLFSTPRGKEITRNAQVQAEKLGNAAAENGKQLAQQGQEKLSQGLSMAQDSATETKQYAGNVLSSGKQTTANDSNKATDAAFNTKNQTGDVFQGVSQPAPITASRVPELSTQGTQHAAQGAGITPLVDRDFLDSRLDAGDKTIDQRRDSGFASSFEKPSEEILDHSKVNHNLQGGVQKVLF